MFMGEYNHTVDTKGRLIIPSKFREQLGSEFIVTKGLDGCLSIYDLKSWESLQEKLKLMPFTNRSARDLQRFMVGSAVNAETDKQGRILLSTPLREYASIEKEAVLIGNIDHIEIWSKEAWNSASSIDADATAQSLYDSGITL